MSAWQSRSTQKCAFTLAEVLITLGIIGVVAALTIPTLMQSVKNHQKTTSLKKFYSTITNAIKLSEVENGSCDKWFKAGNDTSVENYQQVRVENTRIFFETYIAPYIKYNNTSNRLEEGIPRFIVSMTDGTEIIMINGGCMDYMYDINGEKGPNEKGKDRFTFLQCLNEQNIKTYCDSSGKLTFCGYYALVKTRDELLQLCTENGIYCAGLLQKDDWEFKEDYPY
ncbi:prepilin-type N-terminal cleavage/methylation domain-containing protein [bacterium]|nr:prepilin-type N-terminal cleavage/methylation domain-containing protein [bacterium]